MQSPRTGRSADIEAAPRALTDPTAARPKELMDRIARALRERRAASAARARRTRS